MLSHAPLAQQELGSRYAIVNGWILKKSDLGNIKG